MGQDRYRPNYRSGGSDPTYPPSDPVLEGDAKILYEAFQAFSKGGIKNDEKTKLAKIDEVLQDASIQLQKNGGAIITDSNGKSTTVRPR